MRSRQGQTICVGCGPVNEKKEKAVEEVKEDKSYSSTEIISKSSPQKEKAPLKPVTQKLNIR